MKESVKERVVRFLKHKRLSQASFANTIGVSTGYVNNIVKGIGADVLLKIQSNFPELNIEWLMTGDGKMLKPTTQGGNSGSFHRISNSIIGEGNYTGYIGENSSTDAHVIELLRVKDAMIDKLSSQIEQKDKMIDNLNERLAEKDKLISTLILSSTKN